MNRFFYANPLAAIKTAIKYEALGFVVDVQADGDVICVTIYKIEEVRHVA